MKHEGYVVGIGAAEGGISAINKLFKEIPTYTGSIFIIYLYVTQKDVKTLKLTLQKHTKMPVEVVGGMMTLQPNHIYIVEPGTKVKIEEDKLYREVYDGQEALKPIDTLFTMIANTAKERAIGVILSGAQSDGAMGAKAIFQQEGLMILQSEKSAQFIGMLRYVAATNYVHYVAGVDQMFAVALKHITRKEVPVDLLKDEANAMLFKEVLESVKKIGFYDLSYYRRTIVVHAIRKQLKNIRLNEPDKYLFYLKSYQKELKRLQEDILQDEQGLFEREEVFKSLYEHVLPRIFNSKKEGEAIKIWIPACGIGRVAYGALILCETYQEMMDKKHPIVIYATDINEQKLAYAQRGIYDADELYYISENNKVKFFNQYKDKYRVKDNLTQKIIFERHDIVKEIPYGVPDIIILKDLLRYLNYKSYKNVLLTLYSKMHPETYLVLETEEMVGDMTTYFNCIDRTNNIYQRGGYTESKVYL